VKVAIESGLCTGHARCAEACPEVFSSDEAGYAILLTDGNVPPGLEARAAQAVEGCPERAISIVDGRSTPATSAIDGQLERKP
jgi:ferredoxin